MHPRTQIFMLVIQVVSRLSKQKNCSIVCSASKKKPDVLIATRQDIGQVMQLVQNSKNIKSAKHDKQKEVENAMQVDQEVSCRGRGWLWPC